MHIRSHFVCQHWQLNGRFEYHLSNACIAGMHVVSVTPVSKLYIFFMTGILAVREF